MVEKVRWQKNLFREGKNYKYKIKSLNIYIFFILEEQFKNFLKNQQRQKKGTKLCFKKNPILLYLEKT